MLETQGNNKLSHTNATFKALNDTVIPQPLKKQGQMQSADVLEHSIDAYQAWTLNHSLSPIVFKLVLNIYLAKPTAKMLDAAARQLIKNNGHKEPVNPVILNEAGGAFAALAPSDRLRALSLLEQLKVSPSSLPFPFLINSGLVLSVTGTLIMLTTIGYYSGWTGYGSTSLEAPEKRTIEGFPASWKQAGYPGPAKGYHGFRGYLIDKFTE
ncbi:MAG: hypothetical protein VB084_12910 [Syntrophomonadaceae bacterium]|nr:hypothetical protein [Syntrophomonadaceae bacterium]